MRLSRGRVAAALLTLFFVLYLAVGRQYSLGLASRPGAGFFPLLIGIIGIVLALWEFWSAAPTDHKTIPLSAIALIAVFLLFAVILQPLGFLLTGMICTAAMARAFGLHHPVKLVALTIVAPIALYLLFVHAFGVELPRGPGEWILFSVT
jgi:hypothetical protein